MMKKRMIHWLGLTGILAVLSYYSRSGVLTPSLLDHKNGGWIRLLPEKKK